MRQFAFKVTFATVVVACAALVSSTAAAAPAVAARPQYLHGGLGDLKILGPHLAWAVGSARPHSGDGPLLAQRWDGTRWRRVTVPAEPGHDAGFIKVDGSSPDDVWAIGAYTEGPAILSFADHWDGSSWTRVHIPNVHRLPYISLLQGLSVVSTDDAWASGTDGSDRPWVLHWNGTAWTRVPCPDFGGQWGTNIWGIAAFSADDATIVGEVGTRSGTGRTFAAHWDGTTWTRMTTPNIAGKLNAPWSVGSSSPTNIWAAGYAINTHTGHQIPMAMHFDGTSWRLTTMPPPGPQPSVWNVATSSPTDAWAVGDSVNGPATWHWDGTSWHVVTPSRGASDLAGVGDFSPRLAIVGGNFSNGHVLHERWKGHGWQR